MQPTPLSRKRRVGWTVVAFVVLAAIGFGSTVPVGPKEADEGRITGFRYVRGATSAVIISKRDGSRGRAPLPFRHDCKVGDVIRLQRWKRVWGTGFRPADDPPCNAPFSQQ